MPTIHRHESPNPNQSAKKTDPKPRNCTDVNDKFAPQTTKPAIKNSPNNLVLGAKRARSSRNPTTKIPREPIMIEPTTGFSPKSRLDIWGTVNPAMKTTTKKEIRIAAPTKPRSSLFMYFSCSLRTVYKPSLESKKAYQRSKNTSQNCSQYKKTVDRWSHEKLTLVVKIFALVNF